ncbi:MAG TPA: O-antigen ligase family protein [Verrucomicrobiae bacterium]|nr:O-antigen ligase family protein [Verrucomicrobiae bacterium]
MPLKKTLPIFEADLGALISAGALLLLICFLRVKDLVLPGALSLVLGFGGAGFCLYKRRPDIFLSCVIAYVPFSKILRGEEELSQFTILFNAALVAAAGLLYVLTRSSGEEPGEPESFSLKPQARTLVMALLVFLAFQLVSILHHLPYGPDYLRQAFVHWVGGWGTPALLFLILCFAVRDTRDFKTLAMAAAAGAFAAALLGLHEYFDIGNVGDFDRGRVLSIAQEPNMSASFFCFAVFLFAAFILQHWRKPAYWAWLIPIGIALRVITVTYSRGAYLALAAGCAAVAFFRSRILFLVMAGAAIFVLLNPSLLPETVRSRFQMTFEHHGAADVTLDRSSEDRIHVWRGALRVIQAYPWEGAGYDLFETRVIPFWAGTVRFNGHNLFLMVTAELGVPALLVFLFLLSRFLGAGMRALSSPDPFARTVALGFVSGAVAFVAANMFSASFAWQEVSVYFWLGAGLVTRLQGDSAPAAIPQKNTGPKSASEFLKEER